MHAAVWPINPAHKQTHSLLAVARKHDATAFYRAGNPLDPCVTPCCGHVIDLQNGTATSTTTFAIGQSVSLIQAAAVLTLSGNRQLNFCTMLRHVQRQMRLKMCNMSIVAPLAKLVIA